MHGVAAEVTQKVGVLFHHRDRNAGAGQQQAEHHSRRPAAGDQTGRFGSGETPADLGTSGCGPRETKRNSVSQVNGFLNWWDGIELWLSGLAFVLQAMVVMPIVLALAYVTAVVLDRLLGKGIQFLRWLRRADGAPG